jgi:DNA-binding ferritin-like protein
MRTHRHSYTRSLHKRGGKGTRRRRTKHHVTLRTAPASQPRVVSAAALKRRLVEYFFEILLMVKLYHWNTYSYATHKATDDLYSKLGDNIDRFMEVLLGKTAAAGMDPMGGRIKGVGAIQLVNIDDKKEIAAKVEQFEGFLRKLGDDTELFIDNSDLLTIRDEILADLNQFLYLLTLH